MVVCYAPVRNDRGNERVWSDVKRRVMNLHAVGPELMFANVRYLSRITFFDRNLFTG